MEYCQVEMTEVELKDFPLLTKGLGDSAKASCRPRVLSPFHDYLFHEALVQGIGSTFR
jgi:hypothetical protein